MPETAEKTFKAAEVCKTTDVAPYVLKYWLTEFPCLSAADKDKSLNRSYSEKEVQIVSRIRQLLYDEGFTIAGAKKKIDAEIAGGEFQGKPGAKKKASAPAPAPVKPIPLPPALPLEPKATPSPAPRAASPAPAEAAGAPAPKTAPAADAKRLAKELREILKILSR